MKGLLTGLPVAILWLLSDIVGASAPSDKPNDLVGGETESPRHLKDETQTTTGRLVVAGHGMPYTAKAGILVVHVKDPMDSDPQPFDGKTAPPSIEPEAGMSYVAYFLGKVPNPTRPITFLFNGGPGSSTVWLHMGAFGPKRVVTLDDTHNPAAPYRIIDNSSSLLPESDLVFIDAPGTGFGHLRGADKEKAFFGVDPDAHAFANFIVEFLSRHGRWNSPKYLFGESYGTTRAAVLASLLQTEKLIDLNGVMLLSVSLSLDNGADAPQFNPNVDQPYALILPSYAASAWYHKKLAMPAPAALEPFLAEVEHYALNEYLLALAAGSQLSPDRRAAVADKLHAYTGLPIDLIGRADLRINGGTFEQHVLDQHTVGRLDARFAGPAIDPLSKEADYDPLIAALSAAYVSAFNEYVRRELKFGDGKTFKPTIPNLWTRWDFQHQAPGAALKLPFSTNVMPDLAFAMRTNPRLKVQMHGGYFDLGTPYFAAEYEFQHLALPQEIANNIEIKLYPSGHMVYAHEPSLIALHDNAAAFIRRTSGSADVATVGSPRAQ